MGNSDIDIEVVIQMDLDKYVNWLLTNQGVSEDEKKASFDALRTFLMERDEDDSAAHRIAHEDVYIKTKYWIPPSDEVRGNFPLWREHSLKDEQNYFSSRYEHSPLPQSAILEKEKTRIGTRINNLYTIELQKLTEGWVTEKYYEMASLIGMIDYLKKICVPEIDLGNQNIPEKKPAKKFIAKELALAYILDLYAAGKQIPINRVDGAHDAKEISRIGQTQYGIKGDTFYRAVKDIRERYDLNKDRDLQQISKDWYSGVMALTKNRQLLQSYLEGKGLIHGTMRKNP